MVKKVEPARRAEHGRSTNIAANVGENPALSIVGPAAAGAAGKSAHSAAATGADWRIRSSTFFTRSVSSGDLNSRRIFVTSRGGIAER